MINGITSTGFSYQYEEKVLKDWEYLNNAAKIMDPETTDAEKFRAVNYALFAVLGKEQAKALLNHVRRNNDGVAETIPVMTELNEIVKAARKDEKEEKN